MKSPTVYLPRTAADELDTLVEQLAVAAMKAKDMSIALAEKSNQGDHIEIQRSSLESATETLRDCFDAVKRAMDVLQIISDEAPCSDTTELGRNSSDSFNDMLTTSDDLDEMDEIDEEPSPHPSMREQSDEDDFDDDNDSSRHLNHIDSSTSIGMPPHSRSDNSIDDFPTELKLDPMHHLLFVIHGIGEHEDFKAGNAGQDGDYPAFKALFRALQTSSLFHDVPLVLDLESIEWHDALHTPTGVDAVFDLIAPAGSKKIRAFNKRAFMDILYYSSPKYGQLIVDAVTAQMNAKYAAYRAAHVGWTGRVSIFAHSLGTIIGYDILTHARGETRRGITFPGLDFPVDTYVACGSPVPVMVLARGDVNLDACGVFTPGIRMPRCGRYANLVHPSDPIAYRVEPLFYGTVAASVALVSAHQCKHEKMTFQALAALWDTLTTPADENAAPRLDFETRRYRQEGLLELANAPAAHSTYWASEDVVLFVLMQMARPVADALRQYAASGRPMPALSHRHALATLSPATCVDLVASATVKHHVAHHARVVLLDDAHLFVV
ncbi:hypothetical protein As57867_005662, partial [Aphanomyces stellatus]